MPTPDISARVNLDGRLSDIRMDDEGVTLLRPMDQIPTLCTPGLAVGAVGLGLAAEEAADD